MAVGAAAGIIAAGISAAASGAQMISTGKLNKKNRAWQEDMWNKTNDYNTPTAQMQRYKEAGLNPHLIYGQGNSGNTQIPSAPKQENQNFSGFADAAQNYVASRKQQAEIDNLQKAQEVMDADINQKKAQAANLISSSQMTDVEKKQLEDLYEIRKTQAQANLRSTNVGIDNTQTAIDKAINDMKNSNTMTKAQVSKLEADKAQIKQNMTESAERIRVLRVEGNNKAIETEIQRAKADLWKRGINPESSAGQRVLKEWYEGLGLDASGYIKGVKSEFNNATKKGSDFFEKHLRAPIRKLRSMK